MSAALLILDVYFALVLGLAALAKLDDLPRFGVALAQQGWPRSMRRVLRPLVPATEGALALLLASGRWPQLAALGTLLLYAAFLAVRLHLLLARSAAPCGCGARQHPVRRVDVDRAVVSLLLAAALWALAVVAPAPPASVQDGVFLGVCLVLVGLGLRVAQRHRLRVVREAVV